MMITHIRYFFFIVIMLIITSVFSQEKIEKESRLSVEKVPSEAKQFVASLMISNKIKWYLEEGLTTNSIEAKFKKDKQKYSVEFTTSGILEDVEIEIKWNALRKEVQKAIQNQLNLDCIKHKIVKIQIQYSGSTNAIIQKIIEQSSNANLTTNYEIVVKCKSDQGKELMEYLFDEKGNKIRVTKIIFKASSNLEY